MHGVYTQYRNDTTNEWFDQIPAQTKTALVGSRHSSGTKSSSIRAFGSLAAARAAYSKPAAVRHCKSPLLHGIQTNLSTNFVNDRKRWTLVFDVPFNQVITRELLSTNPTLTHLATDPTPAASRTQFHHPLLYPYPFALVSAAADSQTDKLDGED